MFRKTVALACLLSVFVLTAAFSSSCLLPRYEPILARGSAYDDERIAERLSRSFGVTRSLEISGRSESSSRKEQRIVEHFAEPSSSTEIDHRYLLFIPSMRIVSPAVDEIVALHVAARLCYFAWVPVAWMHRHRGGNARNTC